MSHLNHTSNHLDKSVLYLFIVAFFVSITVFAFRYSTHTPCENTAFKINADNYTIGALIKFEDKTINANSWTWDFGDNSQGSFQKQPLHVYKEAGDYTISLIVNNSCEYIQTITIESKKEIIDSTKFPVFELPKSIMVGKTINVKDLTPNASSWEWRFGETSSANAKTKNAKYAYKEPGLKTVSLIVNGDLKHITKKKIEVIPEPVKEEKVSVVPVQDNKPAWSIKNAPQEAEKEEKNAPKVVPYINESDFANKLMLVAKEKMSPKQFSEYFCGDINKKIIVNGKDNTFLKFCEKISGKRRTKIKKIQIYRDKGSNCIKTITVDCRIPGFFND